MKLSTDGFLKKYNSQVAMAHGLLDPLIITAVFSFFFKLQRLSENPTNLIGLIIIFLISIIIFNQFGLYQSWRGASFLTETKKLFGAWSLIMLFVICLGQLPGVRYLSTREILLPSAIISSILLIFTRIFIRLFLYQVRKKGRNIRKAIIVGAGQLGQKVLSQIIKNQGSGVKVLGFFDDLFEKDLKRVENVLVLGTLKHIPSFVREEEVDIVYLTLPFRAEKEMRELVNDLSDTQVAIHLIPDIFVFQLLHTRLLDLGGLPVFSLFDTPFVGISSVCKRIQDLILASLILTFVSPLMALIGIIIKITTKGPIFFVQRRYGLNSDEIRVYKFCTMTVCEDGPQALQAKRNDPRITKFGALLRKTSLDELPQLLNVIQGRMSLVGPRPHPVALNNEFRKLIPGYMLRHKVKPGITGWAQVNGWRGETDTLEKMQKRVQYDLEYINNWSFSTDLKIIFLTIVRGFTGKNAY
jgi:putative colanic acid biosynthesis UDP-glucose lipid carrier transferase